MQLLPCVEVEPQAPAEMSLIWLHGLGADGHDFAPLAPLVQRALPVPVRLVFPHAPVRPVTINGGLPCPAWFDILRIGEQREIDRSGLLQTARAIEALIEREVARGVAPERILLAGFSQGGAVAYQVALTCSSPLMGVVALSTYLPEPDTLGQQLQVGRKGLPLFVAHGRWDEVVPYSLGEKSRNLLVEWGFKPSWREYSLGHEVSGELVDDLLQWLRDLV